MALVIPKHALLFFTIAMAAAGMARASDPDILSDFILPPNTTSNLAINGTYFTYSGLRPVIEIGSIPAFTAIKATAAEFPALSGQSVSFAALLYPSGSVNPPHTHPRSAELLFLASGYLEVGFVDTTNKLYTQTLQAGDMFVFPKGLLHYQYCSSSRGPAIAISAFGSASAGTVSVPGGVFTSGIDVGILAKSFKTDAATIEKLKAGLAPK
ncbi:hypothetical protein Taro_035886 [Colocasia esculenta]|uniref:Germin-like protein n=1 Tax=Colocasia esculenta TaxID=4460 RepID=A0A843W046_COLES|nr:hypothetical protein [Colocasia esculenta]